MNNQEFEKWHTEQGYEDGFFACDPKDAWQAASARKQREIDALNQQVLELSAQVNDLREALNDARLFIVNGVYLGYIRMPDKETPDPAHDTLPNIYAALSIQPSSALQAHDNEVAAKALEEAAGVVEMTSEETSCKRAAEKVRHMASERRSKK